MVSTFFAQHHFRIFHPQVLRLYLLIRTEIVVVLVSPRPIAEDVVPAACLPGWQLHEKIVYGCDC